MQEKNTDVYISTITGTTRITACRNVNVRVPYIYIYISLLLLFFFNSSSTILLTLSTVV
jgi:hypothetical protein